MIFGRVAKQDAVGVPHYSPDDGKAGGGAGYMGKWVLAIFLHPCDGAAKARGAKMVTKHYTQPLPWAGIQWKKRRQKNIQKPRRRTHMSKIACRPTQGLPQWQWSKPRWWEKHLLTIPLTITHSVTNEGVNLFLQMWGQLVFCCFDQRWQIK